MKNNDGKQIREIIDLIRELDIKEYCELMDYLMDTEGMTGLYEVAMSNTLFFETYLESKRRIDN